MRISGSSVHLAAVVTVGLSLIGTRAEGAEGVFFYDPDANHQAIVRLSSLFNSYFGKVGISGRFHPIQQETTFEAEVAKGIEFAIISSNYLERSKGDEWKPVLVPTQKGNAFYWKLLLTMSATPSLDLRNKTIAATLAAGQERKSSQRLLERLRSMGAQVEGAQVLRVSKDIDGLMALVSGGAHAALTTPVSLDILRRINRAVADRLSVAKKTPPMLRAPLCVRKGVPGERRTKVVKAFESMSSTPAGKQILRAMAVDGWTPMTNEMLAHIQPRGRK